MFHKEEPVYDKDFQVDICNKNFSSACNEKFLGIKIDNELTFEENVEGLCKKNSQKVSALARISSLLRLNIKSVSLIHSELLISPTAHWFGCFIDNV